MTHLPYSTDFPKPGDALTAAQANALPVGSETSLGGLTFERLADGWACKETEAREMILYTDGHALLRVGPAPQFVVGQVVTREELDALPIRAEMLPDQSPAKTYKKHNGGWVEKVNSDIYPSRSFCSHKFIITSLPAPACPHAEGTLDWAHWKAEHEGACVKAERTSIWAFCDGLYCCCGEFSSKWNEGRAEPFGDFASYPGPWRVVPDPSLPAASPATPVLQIDPAAIAATLDEAIPEWRDGMTVAQAVGELNLRIGLYQSSDKELREKVEALTKQADEDTELLSAALKVDRAIAEALDNHWGDWRAYNNVAQAIEELGKACWRLQGVEVATDERMEGLRAEVATLTAERDNYERETMKALEQRDAREAMLDRFVEALGGIEACGEHTSNNCPWHVALERAEALTAERDAAIARAEKAEMEVGIVLEANENKEASINNLAASREALEGTVDRLRAELAQQPRVVVPERVHAWAEKLLNTDCDDRLGDVKAALFILSLADHFVDVNKKVPFTSAHPEGSREWAEDAMRAGLAVANEGEWSYRQYPDGTFRCSEDGDMWGFVEMLDTGWRIHTPAVAQEPLTSVVKELKLTPEQRAAALLRAEINIRNAAKWIDKKADPLPSLESLDARLKAVETRLANGEAEQCKQ